MQKRIKDYGRAMCDIDADMIVDAKWDHEHLYTSDIYAVQTGKIIDLSIFM